MRFQNFEESFSSDGIAAPFVKKMSDNPSPSASNAATPPAIASIRCFRGVGLCSRAKSRPDSGDTSRKRIPDCPFDSGTRPASKTATMIAAPLEPRPLPAFIRLLRLGGLEIR